MSSSSKKIKIIFSLIITFCVIVIGGFVYLTHFYEPKAAGKIYGARYIDSMNSSSVSRLESYNKPYIYLKCDDDNYYLHLYDCKDNKSYEKAVIKYTKDQLDSLEFENDYWFKTKFIDGNENNQSLLEVTTDNPNAH